MGALAAQRLSLALLLFATDCAPEAPEASPYAPLEGAALLRRLSLDLRGTLPTETEIAAVAANPEAVWTVADIMVESDAFERRFADLVAEQWLTRVDEFNVGAIDYGLDAADEPAFVHDVGSEVPVFLAAVAAEDLPWTEAVRADWTMTTPLLMQVWGLEEIDGRDSARSGWVRARYTDGRPAGGVVMTNGMWWRYWSAPNNFNRTRAAAIGRLLLCDDWLTRPVHIDAAAFLEGSSLEDAVSTQPACIGCHDSLDPLASALFGYWWFDLYDPLEMRGYHPEREFLGERYLHVAPAWFGREMSGPADLGRMIAEDPRFLRCTAQRVAQSYWRRTPGDDDFAAVNGLVAEFEAGGWTMRSLVRAVIHSPEYAASGFAEGAEVDDAIATQRVFQPTQLAAVVEEVTGYTWTESGYDQLDNDLIGYRVLAGGVDGAGVAVPGEDPSVTRALVDQRLAEAAAAFVVRGDLAVETDDRRLLTKIAGDEGPDNAAFAEQLRWLHERMHGHEASEAEVAEEVAFAEQLVAAGYDVEAVWTALVQLNLRDPAFWTY